jgi:acyl-CoA thioesterase-1
MVYSLFRPGGWKNKPDKSTPISGSAMDHIEQGVLAASQDADYAKSQVDGRLSEESLSTAFAGAPVAWVADTAYPKNTIVINAGSAYVALAAVPARSTFAPADWQALGSSATDGVPVLMLGDSIIFGQGTSPASTNGVVPRTAAWLQSILGGTYTLINAGIQGNTTGQMLARLPALLTQHKPKIVTLSATVNDNRINNTGTNGETVANLRKMIALCRLAGARPILLTNTPYDYVRFGSANYDATSAAKRITQVAAVVALAAELRVDLADLDAAFAQAPDFPTTYTSDGLHPNNAGANLWAQVIAYAIAAQPPLTGLGATTTYAADNFNRADGALGSTPTGNKAWNVAPSATAGIVGNQLKILTATSGTDNDVYVDDGQVDGIISVKMGSTLAQGLVFRSTGNNGYLLYRSGGSQYTLARRTGPNAYSALQSTTGVTPTVGDVLTVTLSGSSISVAINGAAQFTVTNSDYIGTRHGVWCGGTGAGALFDDFSHVSG